MEYKEASVKDYLTEYDIVFTKEEVAAKRSALIQKIKSSQNIPGYRKGKAPEYVVISMFRDYIDQAIQEDIVRDFYQKLIADKKDPIHFGLKEFKLSEGTAKFEIEYMPEIKFKRYKGIEVEEVEIKITDEHVQKTYKDILNNLGTWEDYDGPVENDVLLELKDYIETMEGKELHKMDKFPILYQDGKTPAPLYNKLKEVKKGEQHDFNAKYGEDAPEHYRNKEVNYKFSVSDLKRKKLPDETEELFGKIVKDAKSKNEVLKKLREDIETSSKADRKKHSIMHIFEKIVEENPFELPPNYLEAMKEEVYEKENENYKKQYGMSMEQLNISKESIGSNVAFGIKVNNIRKFIIEQEKLEVSEEEIDKFFMRIAVENNISLESVKSFYKSNEKYMENLKNDLITDKVDDVLYGSAKIKYVSPEEHEKKHKKEKEEEKEKENKT